MPEVERVMWPPRPRKKRKRSRISGEFIYTRQQLEKILWNTYSTYIRAKYRVCVQRDQPGHRCWGYLQAGHLVPRGFGPTKFDEWNVFAQCEGGNKEHFETQHSMETYDTSQQSLFTKWFIHEYGEGRLRQLWQKARRPWKDYSADELMRINSYYQHKTIELAR